MAHWKPVDQVQDLVNKMGGEEGISQFLSGQLKLVPRDPESDLFRSLGEPISFPAVSRFDGAKSFTKVNGIAYLGEDFKQFILPVVEENVAAATLNVSELTRDAKDLRIAADLSVDERGEVALAHFFGVLMRQSRSQAGPLRIDGWPNGAYVVGIDDNTWAVFANLRSGGWHVDAYPLGGRHRWHAGFRFLSR